MLLLFAALIYVVIGHRDDKGVIESSDICVHVPKETVECYTSAAHHPVDPTILKVECLHKLLWAYTHNQNLSDTDKHYFTRLSEQFIDDPVPSSGFRLRMEYRQLSDNERERLHRALQILYEDGTIHKYGRLYNAARHQVHNGPAFLGYNRVFLAFFEEELRRIDRTVTLPYWDYTMDAEMDNPVNSVVWSSKLFGNGNGHVVTGDFANWRGPKGTIQRNYGHSNYGLLTRKDVFRKLSDRCHMANITYPIAKETEEKIVIEFHKNGVFNWIGGTLANRATSPNDPVFYFAHAYSDYIWEIFRQQQETRCKIDPMIDYPEIPKTSPHAPFEKMVGFSKLTNMHGLLNFWTENWYKYKTFPKCPDCESKYLWCDHTSQRCVSNSRRSDYNLNQNQNLNEPFEPDTVFVPRREDIPSLPSPLNDGRTHATAARDAKVTVDKRSRADRAPAEYPRAERSRADIGAEYQRSEYPRAEFAQRRQWTRERRYGPRREFQYGP